MALKIMLVDDDPTYLELLSLYLTNDGWEVAAFSSGREALGQVRRIRPDLILLDMEMPDLSGFDLARLLKQDPKSRNIPILATAALSPPRAGECLAAGCDDYIVKPFKYEELRKRLSRLCAEPGVFRKPVAI